MAVIEAIATTYLEADAASVEFTSIPATYEHLQLRMSVMGDRTASDNWYFYLRLNGDTGTNYSGHRMYGAASSTSGGASTGQDATWTPNLPTLGGNLGLSTGGNAAAYGGNVIDFLDYANTNKNTTFLWLSGVGTGTSSAGLFSGLWDSTAAVNAICLAPDNIGTDDSIWQRGSEFTLYGLNSS